MKNSKNLSLLSRLGKLQRLFLVALFSVLAIGAAAQSKTVSGTVTDKTGETVIGASVVEKVLQMVQLPISMVNLPSPMYLTMGLYR